MLACGAWVDLGDLVDPLLFGVEYFLAIGNIGPYDDPVSTKTADRLPFGHPWRA